MKKVKNSVSDIEMVEPKTSDHAAKSFPEGSGIFGYGLDGIVCSVKPVMGFSFVT
jgi:hypothetical protein